ncbi:MAG: zinc ribbon domain-containing protein [Actinobacteria bacterium]|nr:zinc ribbon domain-containing protein [Actinomycetota bacterium]
MFIHCPSCGAENVNNANYCSLCFSTLGFGDEHFWIMKENKDFEIGMSPKPVTNMPQARQFETVQVPEERPVDPIRVKADLGDIKGVTGAPIEGAISYIPLSDRFKRSLERNRRGEAAV